jgi:hypothetical protein
MPKKAQAQSIKPDPSPKFSGPTQSYLALVYLFVGRFLNQVQVENFASSKLEVNKFILIKFETCKFSAWTQFKNRDYSDVIAMHALWRCIDVTVALKS